MFSLPIALQTLLVSFLWADVDNSKVTQPTPVMKFQLRHQHAVSNTSRVLFSDIVPSLMSETFNVDTQHVISHRPTSFSAFSSARFRSMRHMQNDALLWHETDVLGPNVTNRETLLTLAKMTSNAYYQPGDKDWYGLGSNWNTVCTTVSTGLYQRLKYEPP